ncbi:MAG TPA: NADH-quinone oxidoreductase subunit C [Caldimonas sp.]|nr:NADH-quinone oxidoreductase subunit C [Caldimonas sp.]
MAAARDLETLQRELVPAAGAATVSHGCYVFLLAPSELASTVRRLRDDFGFDVLLDVTAVDWPSDALRFEVVHHLYSTAHKVRVRLKTRVSADDPVVDSLAALYGSSAFMERECHDMYGIAFRGNFDLRPILLYEGFVGHPLRKDYPKQREQPLVPYRD